MVVLDEDVTSSGDSSSTLVDSLSRKVKGKMIGSPLKRKNKSRVLQIGGALEEVGVDEINDMIEAIGRNRADLSLGGTNWVENQRIHGKGSSHGVSRSQAEQGHAACASDWARTGGMARTQASGRRTRAGVGAWGAVLGKPQ